MFVCVSGLYFWLLPLLLTLALMLVPVWWCLAHYNKYTNDVLYSGWTPVIGAMVISRSAFHCINHTFVLAVSPSRSGSVNAL